MEKNYRYYTDEQLEIASIDSKLSKEEKLIRRYLMNYVIENKKAFNVKNSHNMAYDVNMEKEETDKILESLFKKNVAVSDETGNINFIYPVSAIPTNHKITLSDGRTFSAMCAIDGMGTAFTFKKDVEIQSMCSNCGNDIKVSIKDGKIHSYEPEDLHILHVDLNKNSDWSGNC